MSIIFVTIPWDARLKPAIIEAVSGALERQFPKQVFIVGYSPPSTEQITVAPYVGDALDLIDKMNTKPNGEMRIPIPGWARRMAARRSKMAKPPSALCAEIHAWAVAAFEIEKARHLVRNC